VRSAFAELIVEPMFAKSAAAAATNSGAAMTNAIADLPTSRRSPEIGRQERIVA
jgi:hypothetical protein